MGFGLPATKWMLEIVRLLDAHRNRIGPEESPRCGQATAGVRFVFSFQLGRGRFRFVSIVGGSSVRGDHVRGEQ